MKILAMIQAFLLCPFSSCSKKQDYSEVISRLEARQYEDKSYSFSLPYRLFIPAEYDALNTYPLILVLHAGGAQGRDNKAQIGYGVAKFVDSSTQSFQPCFVLVPQCPPNSQWLNTAFKKTPFDNYYQDAIPESEAMKMIVGLLAVLQREFSIDSDRLYVIGSSMGASGTWDIITRYPNLFAAAVTMSGVSDPTKAGKVAHMPIWSFHGSKDQVSPVYVTKNMIKALKQHGSACKFTEYKDRGHDINGITYDNPEIIRWLLSQQKPQTSLKQE